MEELVLLEMSVSKQECILGEIITYKIDITNVSNSEIHDIIIKDLLPQELKFIIGSIFIDFNPCENSNIISGVNIDILSPNEKKTITFDAEVYKQINETIKNKVTCEYKIKIDEKEIYRYLNSDDCSIYIKNPSIKVLKECDKNLIYLDEVVNFNIKIINDGDTDIVNILFKEEFSENLELQDGSFCINNISVNSVEMQKGIALGVLNKGEIKDIMYSLKLKSGSYKSRLDMKSYFKYSYTLNDEYLYYKKSDELLKSIKIGLSSFKYVHIENEFNLQDDRPEIKELNNLKVNIQILNYKVIKTPVAKASDGKILSGHKLIIHGKITQILEYISDDSINMVYTSNYSSLFSSYITLPDDFFMTNNIEVNANVEDVYYQYIHKKKFFCSVAICLKAKINL